MNHILVRYKHDLLGATATSWVLLRTERDVQEAINKYFDSIFGQDTVKDKNVTNLRWYHAVTGQSVRISIMEMLNDTDAHVMGKYIECAEI